VAIIFLSEELVRIVLIRIASVRFAPSKIASGIKMPDKFAPVRFADGKLTLISSRPCKSASERSIMASMCCARHSFQVSTPCLMIASVLTI